MKTSNNDLILFSDRALMVQTRDDLIAVYDYFDVPDKWCQGNLGLTSHGETIVTGCALGAATRVCAMGALHRMGRKEHLGLLNDKEKDLRSWIIRLNDAVSDDFPAFKARLVTAIDMLTIRIADLAPVHAETRELVDA